MCRHPHLLALCCRTRTAGATPGRRTCLRLRRRTSEATQTPACPHATSCGCSRMQASGAFTEAQCSAIHADLNRTPGCNTCCYQLHTNFKCAMVLSMVQQVCDCVQAASAAWRPRRPGRCTGAHTSSASYTSTRFCMRHDSDKLAQRGARTSWASGTVLGFQPLGSKFTCRPWGVRLCDACFEQRSLEFKIAEQIWSIELPAEVLESLPVFTKCVLPRCTSDSGKDIADNESRRRAAASRLRSSSGLTRCWNRCQSSQSGPTACVYEVRISMLHANAWKAAHNSYSGNMLLSQERLCTCSRRTCDLQEDVQPQLDDVLIPHRPGVGEALPVQAAPGGGAAAIRRQIGQQAPGGRLQYAAHVGVHLEPIQFPSRNLYLVPHLGPALWRCTDKSAVKRLGDDCSMPPKSVCTLTVQSFPVERPQPNLGAALRRYADKSDVKRLRDHYSMPTS